jgi:hypothetical protein
VARESSIRSSEGVGRIGGKHASNSDLYLQFIGQTVDKNKEEKGQQTCALVAQLDRVPDYESGGCGFESRRAYQNI